jgi:hypothetical protein
LAARRVCVHLELAADLRAAVVVALAEDTLAVTVLVVAPPDDDEVPRGVGPDRRQRLAAGRVRVHLEFGAERASRAVVALAEDAARGIDVLIALPHDDEVARGVAGDRRELLLPRHVRVDLELGSDGLRRNRYRDREGSEKSRRTVP